MLTMTMQNIKIMVTILIRCCVGDVNLPLDFSDTGVKITVPKLNLNLLFKIKKF
jgi:hypothetical protein